MSITPAQFRLVSDIFAKACEVSEAERAGYLDDACANDDELRTQVERLLVDDATPAFSLESPPIARIMRAEGEALFDDPHGQTTLPQSIGDYEIVGLLGRGGMGVVYEARQKHPARSVALKVLRAEIVSGSARRRLQIEAEILGKLQHPGIASIYEAGVAAEAQRLGGGSEQPYFAMELIRGQPLDEYVEQEELPLEKRLDIFAKICDAVHHAHENGIIHRDLKPGNILVDSLAAPKILDFGIARTTDADVRTTTMQTGIGQLIGTIAYMSPEQVTGDSSKLDRRSDVYALGVMGYELLSGTQPHDLTDVPIPEAVRLIRDADPKSLSSINKVFRGDLDTIFCKTLEKDRDRRYSTAAELAADIRRFLDHEPIKAQPASNTYLVKKFVRRNRIVVAGLTAVFLTLITGIAATGWEAHHANIAREHAEREAAISANISKFLRDMLTSVNPRNSNSPKITVREVVDLAAAQLEQDSFRNMPIVESSLRETLGVTYVALGEYAAAEKQLRESLRLYRESQSIPDVTSAEILSHIGVAQMQVGNDEGGEKTLREALDVFRSLSLERTREAASILNDLALIYAGRQEFDQAEALNREVLALRKETLGDAHPDIAKSYNNLAVVLRKKGDLPAAEKAYRQSLAINREVFGTKHIEIATNLGNLGLIRAYRGDFDEAELLLTESLEMSREFYRPDHPRIASKLNGLAGMMQHKGDYSRAEPLYREALAIVKKSLGPTHSKVALFNYNLANLLLDKGSPQEALPFIREAEAIYRGQLPARKRDLADALVVKGLILLALGGDSDAKAETVMRESVELLEASFPIGHAHIAQVVTILGESILKQGRYDEAEPLLLDSYPVILASRGETDEYSLKAMKRIVKLYELWDRPESARKWRERLGTITRRLEDQRETVSQR